MSRRMKYRIAVFTLIVLSGLVLALLFSRITFNSDWRTLVPDNKYSQQYSEIEEKIKLGTQLTLVLSFEDSIDFAYADSLAGLIQKLERTGFIMKPFMLDSSRTMQYIITGTFMNMIDRERKTMLMDVQMKGDNKYAANTAYVNDVEKIIMENSVHDCEISLTGLPAISRDETEGVKRRSLILTIISLMIIFAMQIFVFRSWRYLIAGILSIITGAIWTFIFIALTVRSLNLLTAMFIPVIAGLGIDYVIHLLYGYNNENRSRNRITAVLRSHAKPIMLGVITTSTGFLFLIFSGFALFVQFGLITFFGIIFMFAAVYITVPAFLRGDEAVTQEKHLNKIKALIADNVKFRNTMLALMILVILAAVPGLIRIKYTPDNDVIQGKHMKSTDAANIIAQKFGYYPTPILLYLENKDDYPVVIEYLKKQQHVGFFVSRPDSNYMAYLIQRNIQPLIENASINEIAETYSILEYAHKSAGLSGEFPDISTEGLIYLFPDSSFWNDYRVARFEEMLENIPSKQYKATGIPLIMSSIVKPVKDNIFRLFLFTFISVLVICTVVFRRWQYSLIVFVFITLTYAVTLGLFRIVGQNLHFLNILGLPIMAGIIIDDCIYFLYFADSYSNDVKSALRRITIPVMLTSFTTIAGFGSLNFYLSKGIRSLGLMFVIGFSVSLLLILFLIPAVHSILNKKKITVHQCED